MQKVIVHIDMDAFFAAVEQRDDPNLKGKPVIIGADPKHGKGRGVVSTCSYEARKYGIHSAMPISIAYRKCPHGVFLPGNMKKYKEASRKMMEILYEFTPDIQPISIDEAFLDITESFHLFETPLKTCQRIKSRIKKDMDLNASIGIGPNKSIAKIASDFSKPDGLLEVTPEKMLDFLWPLPIGRIWGVGKKTQAALNKMGINFVKDLAQYPEDRLRKQIGEMGDHLIRMAHGIDHRKVKVDDEVKSVSHEHTFEEDTGNQDLIYEKLSLLSEKVSRRMRKLNLKGKTLSVKIRLSGFKTFTRAHTFGEQVNFFDAIYKQSKILFNVFYKPYMKVRLVGVRMSNFEEHYFQESLFGDPEAEKKEKIHQAVDVIKDKFGEKSIRRGA